MKNLIILLVIWSVSFGQVTIKKDVLRSYCVTREHLNRTNISPNNEWTLEIDGGQEVADSVGLFIFQRTDTLNKIHIMTFYSKNSMRICIQNPFIDMTGPDRSFFSHNTWSENLDTIYIFLTGSTINTTYRWEAFAINISSITGVEIKNPSNNYPAQRVIALNRPNPFRFGTFIQYSIPKSDYVAINIYNNQGRLLRVLKQKYQNEGTYSVKWDGTDNNGNKMANGEYFYQIISGDLITTKKMIFLK